MNIAKLTAVQQLDVMIRARYPGIWIVTSEESRVETTILGMVKASDRHSSKKVYTWSVARGLRAQKKDQSPDGWSWVEVDAKYRNPLAALQFAAGMTGDTGPALFLFKDLHPFFNNPALVRELRDTLTDLSKIEDTRTLIVIAPVLAVPEDCKRQMAVVEWSLPTIDELRGMIEDFIADLPAKVEVRLNGDLEVLARALSGLTMYQAESALQTAVIMTGRLDGSAVESVITEKARIIKESGLLEFFQPDDIPEIGGLDLLRSYLARRRNAFSDKAREFGIPTPKGLLLVGVPGCGKSLACKTLSKIWQLPLIRLDIGALMGSLVGQSEGNLRQALKVAESAAPCIVWLDELEKGLAGVGASGISDGGTTARVFGSLLTWMQEKTAPVFVVATSNDISALPPELLRAGRFDDIFFVNLPNPEERRQIWAIHLARVRRDPAVFDLEALVRESEGYVGSEIETAIGDALVMAFDEDRDLATEDLVDAIRARVPLSTTMDDRIQALVEWAATRAKPSSSEYVTAQGPAKRRVSTLEI